MGGIQFINLGFLAGAAAVALPILVHLWFRQRPRTIDLGTLRFLRLAVRDDVRLRKLRRWILLALRIAGVLLLALMFARPYWARGSEDGGDLEVVVLIDQSASMGVASSGNSPFRKAQQAAEDLLARLPSATAVHLAYYDAAQVEPAPGPTIDRSRKPGYGGTDHARALGWARDLMLLSRRRDRRVYLFTDLQGSGVGRTEFDRWPNQVAIEVVDVGKPLSRNLAVIEAKVDRSDVGASEPPTVSVVVANTGVFPVEKAEARLTLIGGPTTIDQTQPLTIEAGGRQLVRFSLGMLGRGLHEGSVAVTPGDEFPLDDRRWVAIDARATDRILLLEGRPGNSVFEASTYYLEMVLRLRLPGTGATATPYEPIRSVRSPGQALPDLRGYAVVVASDVAALSDAEVRALRDYVVTGGRLVLFPGEQATPASLERLRGARLLAAESASHSELGSYRLARWENEHPIFRALSDPQHGDLRRMEFRRIARLRPDAGARVLATLDQGAPWLIEADLGSGKVLLFAVSASRDSGDWVVHRLYLPLIHQVFAYLTDRLPESRRVAEATSGPGRSNPPGLERVGGRVTCRNLDPLESDFERIPASSFFERYHLSRGRLAPQGHVASPAIAPPPGSQRPDELWRALAWALFAVLAIETFVANRT